MIFHIARLLAVSSILQIFSASASADTVQLRNGDRLSGKVLHLSGDRLTLDTAYAGKLEILRSEVIEVQTDGPVEVMVSGQTEPRQARLAIAEVGQVRLEEATASPGAPRPLADVAFINPKPAESGVGVGYQGRVLLSSARTSGNTSSSREYGEAELNARAKAHAYRIGAKGTQTKDTDNEIASNWLLNGNYDRFIAPTRFLYGRGSIEADRFRGIDLRSAAGAGYGWQLYETETTQLSIRSGVDYVVSDRTDGTSERYSALGWGIRISRWLWTRSLQAFHEQDGFLNLQDTAQANIRSRTGLRIPIASGLSANAQLNVDWEKEPTPGRKSIDSTVLAGLGYQW